MLPPGLYLYAGSAWGPGGIRARVGRHLRHPKSRVWHIDRLTEAAPVDDVIAFPGARECAIVAALPGARECAIVAALPGARVPVPRFGASDCRRCESHLLAVDPDHVDALARVDRSVSVLD